MKFFLASIIILFGVQCWAQSKQSPEFFLKVKRKKIDVILRAADFHTNDVIADGGAAEGWLDAGIAVYRNDLHFYMEDIDSAFIKEKKLQEAVEAYSKIKGGPLSCTFTQSVGNEKSTLLPENYFDKVLLIDTFHHLDCRNDLIADLHRIMKGNGKIVVYELLARKVGQHFRYCKKIIYTREQIIDAFVRNGFRLDQIYKTVNSNRTKVRVFTFYKS